ncbi:MAG: DUF559 domain-containing protein [Actinomycetota bacterium]|nr:DUF559 domain-containing protein [Actinomycetota bacterium]
MAARQHGLVTRFQLRASGLGPETIDYRLRQRRLIAVHRGVYFVNYVRREPVAKAAAAVLAGRPHAVLSHDSAAALWGFQQSWPPTPEVTLSKGDRRTPGIRVHTSKTLGPIDIREHHGIRTTTPARALLDTARRLTQAARARAINDARLAGLIHLDALNDLLSRNPNHPGTPLLAPFVHSPTNPTRSSFEDIFPGWIAANDLPIPRMNVKVCGVEVDALFEAEKVIVELDGYQFHRTRHSFEIDRERDAVLAQAGFLVIRITWERLHRAPVKEAQRLRAILDARRP